MSRKYKFKDKEGAFFISFATINWVDVFTRLEYFQVVINSLDFCRRHKGMIIFGYCIMPSHIHLIFRSAQENPSGLVRDFKGYTSRMLLKCIQDNPQESRKEWMMSMFLEAGKGKTNVDRHQFWQHECHPIEIWSLKVFEQKLQYMHDNPVEAGFVLESTDWKYSSARNYSMDDHSVLEIDVA